MSQSNHPSALPSLITFLVGAAIGAVVVALTTPKSGAHLRNTLRNLARRGKAGARGAVDGFRGTGKRSKRTYVWHVPDPGHDIQVSVAD